MILKLKDKAWNGARQDLRDTTNFDFRSQEYKAMLVTVFESQELIHKEFVPPGQRRIRTTMRKYCLVWFKEVIE